MAFRDGSYRMRNKERESTTELQLRAWQLVKARDNTVTQASQMYVTILVR